MNQENPSATQPAAEPAADQSKLAQAGAEKDQPALPPQPQPAAEPAGGAKLAQPQPAAEPAGAVQPQPVAEPAGGAKLVQPQPVGGAKLVQPQLAGAGKLVQPQPAGGVKFVRLAKDQDVKLVQEEVPVGVGLCAMGSFSRLNALCKLHPDLRPLADSMVGRWLSIRESAMKTLQDRTPEGKAELYRHVASTKLPSLDLIVGMRNHLLTHRQLDETDAKELANRHRQPDKSQPDGKRSVEDQVLAAVTQQLLDEAETIADISLGQGYPDQNNQRTQKETSNPQKEEDTGEDTGAEKEALRAEDCLEWGFLLMTDGSYRAILVEIGGMKEVARPCSVCKKETTKCCGRCGFRSYCSGDCQKQDWTTGEHKTKCNPIHKVAVQEIRTILAQDFHPIVLKFQPPPNQNQNQKKNKIKIKRTPLPQNPQT